MGGCPTQAASRSPARSSPLPPPHPFDRVQGHPSSRRSFNRMKCIETPQPPSCAPTGKARSGTPHLPSRTHCRWPVALLFVPPHTPLPLRRRHESPTKYPGEGRTEEGRLPKNEGFLGPGGMRKRFALAALRSPSQVETRTGGRYFVRRASHPR